MITTLNSRAMRPGFRSWAWDRLGEGEQLGVFLAAEILGPEKFLQANDLRTARGCFANLPDGLFQVLVGIDGTAHLHQANTELGRAHRIHLLIVEARAAGPQSKAAENQTFFSAQTRKRTSI